MVNRLKNAIDITIDRLERTEKGKDTFYLEKVKSLKENFTKKNWIDTGQYHNAEIFVKKYPSVNLSEGVVQVMFYAGEYIVEVTTDNNFTWGECSFPNLNDLEDCIWEKETQVPPLEESKNNE
jgi:hypothetical protein